MPQVNHRHGPFALDLWKNPTGAGNPAATEWADTVEPLRQRGAKLTRSGAFAYAALYTMRDGWTVIDEFRPDDPVT